MPQWQALVAKVERAIVPIGAAGTGAIVLCVLAYAIGESGRFYQDAHLDLRQSRDAFVEVRDRSGDDSVQQPGSEQTGNESLANRSSTLGNDRSGATVPSGGSEVRTSDSARDSDLDWPPGSRSFVAGQTLFEELACHQCHRIKGEGGTIGPDLAETYRKLASGEMTRAELLSEIATPSQRIPDEYQTVIVIDIDGRLVTGVLIEETDTHLRIAGNPLENAGETEVSLEDIEERMTSPLSIMPAGLTESIDRQQLLDLLAYIESNGDSGHPHYDTRSGQ